MPDLIQWDDVMKGKVEGYIAKNKRHRKHLAQVGLVITDDAHTTLKNFLQPLGYRVNKTQAINSSVASRHVDHMLAKMLAKQAANNLMREMEASNADYIQVELAA